MHRRTPKVCNFKKRKWSNQTRKARPVNDVTEGRYRHYKGREYVVIGTARHSETQEELVVYRPDYGEREMWVRPKAMFLANVLVDGQDVPRFDFMGTE